MGSILYPFLVLNPLLCNFESFPIPLHHPDCAYVCVHVCVCMQVVFCSISWLCAQSCEFFWPKKWQQMWDRILTTHFCIPTHSLLLLWRHAWASQLEDEVHGAKPNNPAEAPGVWQQSCLNFLQLIMDFWTSPASDQQNQSASTQTHEPKQMFTICHWAFEVDCYAALFGP